MPAPGVVALPFCAMRPEDVEADLRRVLRRGRQAGDDAAVPMRLRISLRLATASPTT